MKLNARIKGLVAVTVVIAVLALGMTHFVLSRAPSPGKPIVVGSFYPYYFAAASVGGDRVTAVNLVPPGVEPHDWEPSPQDVRAIYDASVFVYNGYVETYLTRVFADLPANGPVLVNASDGMTRTGENGAIDPHVWLDPTRMTTIVEKVAEALSLKDLAGASTYRANADALEASLSSLDSSYQAGLTNCGLRTIVVAHEAFGYLSQRYGLTMVAIEGLSPDAEPTPAKIQEILNIVNQTGVQYIFYEELVDPHVAQTLADEAHVQTMVLDPLEGLTPDRVAAGATYLTIMGDTNLPNLRTALGCA